MINHPILVNYKLIYFNDNYSILNLHLSKNDEFKANKPIIYLNLKKSIH